jgi:hypothetical protein
MSPDGNTGRELAPPPVPIQRWTLGFMSRTAVAAFYAEGIYMCANMINLLHHNQPHRIPTGEGLHYTVYLIRISGLITIIKI